MRELSSKCHICGSGVTDRIVESEMRQYRFERTEFSCGATLESHYSANGNVGRAILTNCGNAE